MKTLMYILILFLASSMAWSQEKKTSPKYYTWVELMNNDKTGKGYLLGTDEKAITYLLERDYLYWEEDELTELFQQIFVEDIKNLEFRKKHSITKGLLMGGLIGGTVTGLFAAVIGSNCS